MLESAGGEGEHERRYLLGALSLAEAPRELSPPVERGAGARGGPGGASAQCATSCIVRTRPALPSPPLLPQSHRVHGGVPEPPTAPRCRPDPTDVPLIQQQGESEKAGRRSLTCRSLDGGEVGLREPPWLRGEPARWKGGTG